MGMDQLRAETLLSDVRSDIARIESELKELRRIESYLSKEDSKVGSGS